MQRSVFGPFVAVALGAAAVIPAQAQAEEATFGCQVLLCAAGNWSSIPYCTPVMAKALRNVRKGKGWPFCAQANMTSRPHSLVRPEDQTEFNTETGNIIDPASGKDVPVTDVGPDATTDTATKDEGYAEPTNSAAVVTPSAGLNAAAAPAPAP